MVMNTLARRFMISGDLYCTGEITCKVGWIPPVEITDPTNQVISNRFGSGHTHSDDYRGKSVLFAVPE